MAALLTKFDGQLASWGNKAASLFTLENGQAQLSQWFAEIALHHYEDALEVTEVDALVDYILSGRVGQVLVGRQPAFREFVAREMESLGGVFHITEAGGLFVSVPKGE
jgi:hypothetical protein